MSLCDRHRTERQRSDSRKRNNSGDCKESSESRKKTKYTRPIDSDSAAGSILGHVVRRQRRSRLDMADKDKSGGGDEDAMFAMESDREEYTIGDVVKMLSAMNANINSTVKTMGETLNKKVGHLTTEVEKMRAEIFELKQENDRLKKDMGTAMETVDGLKSKMREAEFNSKLAQERSNHTEQYSRLWNIKILGIPEKIASGRGETAADSEKLALALFREKLGLNITPADLDAVHRIGEKKPGTSRPIIVRFVSRRVRQQVIQQRKALKGSKVIIVDDLTKANYTLFQAVTGHPGAVRAWSKDGIIFAEGLADGKIVRIERQADIGNKLPVDGVPPEKLQERLQVLAKKNKKWASLFNDK